MTENLESELDLSGLTCPMPLLKTKQALNKMPIGAVIRVIATDPASERDFKVFSEQSGNELLSAERQADRFVYVLRKA
jgi:tRNA 2-thiouridine synthesizing protein A